MSFFKRLFSSSQPTNSQNFDWISLDDLQQLEDVLSRSYEKIVVIFKHSTLCNISKFVLNRFEKEFNYPKEQIETFYLDLLSFRDISNEITRKFEVEHQSPQILVIKNGKVIYSTSHESIDAKVLERFV